jgi:hypothetical protein
MAIASTRSGSLDSAPGRPGSADHPPGGVSSRPRARRRHAELIVVGNGDRRTWHATVRVAARRRRRCPDETPVVAHYQARVGGDPSAAPLGPAWARSSQLTSCATAAPRCRFGPETGLHPAEPPVPAPAGRRAQGTTRLTRDARWAASTAVCPTAEALSCTAPGAAHISDRDATDDSCLLLIGSSDRLRARGCTAPSKTPSGLARSLPSSGRTHGCCPDTERRSSSSCVPGIRRPCASPATESPVG